MSFKNLFRTRPHNIEHSNCVYNDTTQKLLKLSVQELDPDLFKNWEKNRPPDPVRISNILTHYTEQHTTLLPGIVSVWKKPEDANYYVYDGIHRLFAAFKHVQQNKPTPMIVLIHLINTDCEQTIVDNFINVNKAVNVPSLYLENTDHVKRIVCENVAKWLCSHYPTFVSPSRKPFVYNFNRDNLVEFISSLEIDFNNKNVEQNVINELNALNLYAKTFVKDRRIDTPKKCQFHKFFLFYLEKSFIKQQIEQALNEQ